MPGEEALCEARRLSYVAATRAKNRLTLTHVTPDDDTWKKLPFYACRGVDELLIVDPQERRVHRLALRSSGEYQPVEQSGLIALGPAALGEQIDSPE